MPPLIDFFAGLIRSYSRDKLPLNTVPIELTDTVRFAAQGRTTLPVFRGVKSGESCKL